MVSLSRTALVACTLPKLGLWPVRSDGCRSSDSKLTVAVPSRRFRSGRLVKPGDVINEFDPVAEVQSVRSERSRRNRED